MERFEIVDEKGTIYSGDEEEIVAIWEGIIRGIDQDVPEWTGDLRLIKVIAVHK